MNWMNVLEKGVEGVVMTTAITYVNCPPTRERVNDLFKNVYRRVRRESHAKKEI